MTTQTHTFILTGMTCQGCVNSVKTAFSPLAGIENLDINLEKQTVTVTFDNGQTNVETFVQAIDNAGFDIQSHG